MFSCPNGACSFTVKKEDIQFCKAKKCYWCRTNMVHLLDSTSPGSATPALSYASVAAGTAPAEASVVRTVQPAVNRTIPAAAPPWRANIGIRDERVQLQQLQREADEEKCINGRVPPSLLDRIAKSEAKISSLDTIGGGIVPDKFGEAEKVAELQ